MPRAPVTRIQLCGRFAVAAGDEQVETGLPGRRGRLLFAYLAAHRQRPIRRDEVLDALWPDPVPDSAGPSLTVLLSKIRALLGQDIIHGRGELQLHLPVGAVIDTETAEAAAHQAESACSLGDWTRAWGPALAAHLIARRQFLLGNDAPWIDRERSRTRVVNQRALACYARACLGIGGTELPAANRAARVLTELDPLSESGHCLLMQALAARGDTAAALQVYEQLRRNLSTELGIDPGPEARSLHQRLLAHTTARGGHQDIH